MLWMLFGVGLLVLPTILGSIYEIDFHISALTITIYGIITIIRYLIQLVFCIANRIQVNKILEKTRKDTKISLHVIGWRENVKMFEDCLKSIKLINDKNIHQVVICIDGNEREDMYMVEIFSKILNGKVIHLKTGLEDYEETEKMKMVQQSKNNKYICLTAPHKGKRHAMYNGIEYSLSQNVETTIIDYLMFTDSDTILNPGSATQLAKVLDYSPKLGAVTGDVRLFTMDTWLSFVVNFKYWFAFNMERSSQSYLRVVNCVSGPLGMYRENVIKPIAKEWLNQTFLGVKCTYGDDRHLTNLVLKHGHGIGYTHNALCYTETPATFGKWIAQQTRWTKSYIRETIINMKWFHKHNIYLAMESIFGLFYSYVLLMLIIITLMKCHLHTNLILVANLVAIGLIRSFFGIFVEGFNLSYVYYSLYSFLFLFIQIPLKIWGFMTLLNNDWGTGNRIFNKINNIDSILPFFWTLGVLTSFGYSIYNDYVEWYQDRYLIYSISAYFGLLLLFYPFIIRKYRKTAENIRYIRIDETNNNTMIEMEDV